MRWLSGLLAIGIVFFVGQTCSNEHAEITLVFSLVPSADQSPITSFEATVLTRSETVDDIDVVAEMTRKIRPAGSPSGAKNSQREVASWEIGLDPGRYRLELRMTDANGNQWRENRAIEAVPRGTIRISLPNRPIKPAGE